MGIMRWAGGGLASLGGFLMVYSGYSSRGFLYTALEIAEPKLSDYLNGVALNAAVIAVSFLVLLIALGGITVVIGGLLVLANHVGTGRTLIYLGGGAGFLGLLISFGYSTYKVGFDVVLSYAPYWAGLAMAVVGRRLAKGS